VNVEAGRGNLIRIQAAEAAFRRFLQLRDRGRSCRLHRQPRGARSGGVAHFLFGRGQHAADIRGADRADDSPALLGVGEGRDPHDAAVRVEHRSAQAPLRQHDVRGDAACVRTADGS
jgi:hypothetical protein